jgi:uncharacterized membrane protein
MTTTISGLRVGTLLLATGTTGLAAGAFALYAHTIMPALRTTDDPTFVRSFQALDRQIINPWFVGLTFFGAWITSALATFAARGTEAFPWAVAGFALSVVIVVITIAVHVPLNDAIKAAGDPSRIDAAAARERFHEHTWVVWNLVRTVLSLGSLAALLAALYLLGRSSA